MMSYIHTTTEMRARYDTCPLRRVVFLDTKSQSFPFYVACVTF